jgi:hypothetical protein
LPLGYDKMATGVKLVEEKMVQRLQNEAAKGARRPRLEVAQRLEQTPTRTTARVGRPEMDFRYSMLEGRRTVLANWPGEEEITEDVVEAKEAFGVVGGGGGRISSSRAK